MRAEIVTIGNELLNGDLADTNTARLGRVLREQGLRVSAAQTVPDDVGAIVGAFDLAGSRSDLVLVSGGLGPTEDDLTMNAAAAFAGVPLVEHPQVLARLKRRFEERGYPFTANNARQALAPRGAEVLDNPVGTAPCVRLVVGTTTFFFFPGVPRELERLVADHLLTWLERNAATRPYTSAVLKTFGKTESQVASLLSDLPRDPRLHVAYRAHFPEIQVSLHVQEDDPEAARRLLEESTALARTALAGVLYTQQAETSFVDALAAALTRRGETLATAESCTGGLVAKMCTDVPGSSAWFLEGAVTYSNAAKSRQLGVPAQVIAAHGAVSEPVARAMAEGIRAAAGSTWAVAVTGIAGPGGGSPEKPVGTIHFALAGDEGTTHLRRRLPFDRVRNRIVSAWLALDMVRRATSKC